MSQNETYQIVKVRSLRLPDRPTAGRLTKTLILQNHMLEKFTFEKKLGIDSSEKKWIGLKIATVSGLVAFSGGFAAFLGLGIIAYWIVVVGLFLLVLAMFPPLFKD